MSHVDRCQGETSIRYDRARAGEEAGRDSLDDYVLAFEEAYQERGEADPAAFLPPPGHPLHAAVLRELIRVDMEFGWDRGLPKTLDEYRRDFPELARDPEAFREIAYEEFRLRRQSGQAVAASEYRRRYGIDFESLARPGRESLIPWSDGPGEPPGPFPRVGERFLGFLLEAELGRGAFGRVYLARQEELEDRAVVLKVTAARQEEARTLAQLNHENIVPIHSRHRRDGLEAVCMPYLGAVTLREVLEDLKSHKGLPGSGRGLLSSLDKGVSSRERSARPGPEAGTTVAGPARPPSNPTARDKVEIRERLARLTYVEAVLWMLSRLADGLAHAHDRGILHLDLKPANILLTDQGRPLLLDFNLAADLKRSRPGARPGAGGTLPYMAPEHLRAFLGDSAPGDGVDARSDLFALGVIAYELLTGRPPFPIREGHRDEVIRAMIADRRQEPPRLRPWNPAVSPATEAIVRRCLAPDPSRRHADARALVEDIERQLAHRPLRHTPEPSALERAGKCLRRHGRGVSVVSALVIGMGSFSGLGAALASRREAIDQLRSAEALAAFRERAIDAGARRDMPTTAPREVARTVALARDALDRLEIRPGRPGPPWWERPPAGLASPEKRSELRREAGRLLLLVASGELALARRGGPDRPGRLAAARAAIEEAERAFERPGIPRVLWSRRAEILRALGDPEGARLAEARAEATPLVGADDFALEGSRLLERGDFREAIRRFDEAKDLDPRHYAAWLGKGFGHARLREIPHALTAYTACVALDAENPAGWFNRGTMLLLLGQPERAARDLAKALAARPESPEILTNLGAALLQNGDHAQAEAALTRALLVGSASPRVHLMRARARAALGDRRGAEADLAEGLRREPDDEAAWVSRAVARANERRDVAGALADLDEALRRYPDSFLAHQTKASILSERAGKAAEAIAVLDDLLEFYPDHAVTRASRGVLHARLGHRDAALDDVRCALILSPSSEVRYYAACAQALTSLQVPDDAAEAIRSLGAALRGGFGRQFVEDDRDLDPIRGHPDFVAAVRSAGPPTSRALDAE